MKFGFIGAGNMAGAIIRGALGHGFCKNDIFACDLDLKKASDTGATAIADVLELVRVSDVVVLAVKPNVAQGVLKQIHEEIAGKALISIVAGLSTKKLSNLLPGQARYLRIMPNTPLLVGAGAIALCEEHTLEKTEFDTVLALFQALGEVCIVHEYMIDAVTGLSGSGPAYVYKFIEALADGAVMEGLPRDTAYLLAAQTVLGAAQMVLKTGEHPGKLKDAVTSPGGTTILGLYALDQNGFSGAVMQAVHASAQKSREMSE